MAKLVWDQEGKHFYETGTKNGVLYPLASVPAYDSSKTYEVGDKVTHDGDVYICKTKVASPSTWSASSWSLNSAYGKGVEWNGLTGVQETPSGADETALYADDQKYLSLRAAEDFGATVEAYTYPVEFEACDGSASFGAGAVIIGQQKRKTFGMAFKTVIGNDIEGDDHGYKIHLIYGATASPASRAYKSTNNSPEAITFSWELKTVPVAVKSATDPDLNYKHTANITIDSTKCVGALADALKTLEDKLFGTATTDPYLPMPGEIYDLFNPAG